jgi:5'-nucleotidase
VFTVIANHLKSKGSGSGVNADQGDGQGASNPDRVAQAQSLVAFAAQVAAQAGDTDVLLTGDFNAYRTEDPLDVIRAAGYTEVFNPGEYSYVFEGGSGSLDHVFASPSMLPKVTGHTVWDINSVESYAYQYDGFEGLYAPNAYRASDHNPSVLGVNTSRR